MAKLLDIQPKDFEHLTDEDQLRMKRIVYQQKFQEGILDLRASVGISDFPKVKMENGKVTSRKDIDNKSLAEEIDRFCEAMKLPLLPWFNFVYCIVAYNKITNLTAMNHVPNKVAEPNMFELKALEAAYEQDDPEVALYEILLYQSDTLQVSTDKGDIVMRLSPDAKQKEVTKVLRDIKDVRKFFKGKKYGDKRTDYLDMANDALYLSKSKEMTDIQIAQQFHEKYRREETADGVRKMIERAKKMGF